MLRNLVSSCNKLNLTKNVTPLLGRNFGGTKSKEDFDKIVKSDKIVTFIKGVPEQPMCGFSRAVVQILNIHGVKYKSFNVLEDESLRQGMKDYSQWPTFPQVYVDGKFIGGADILYEMHKNKELIDVFAQAGVKSEYSYNDKPSEQK